ncbi:MAG: ATPase [Thermoprotei archaeon]|nr:MAG: ATPase [Thermoprotei archaeon]
MEIVIASGKGGTGKTFLSSNLIHYMNKYVELVIGADADVEAPDLALALGGVERIMYSENLYESRKAVIDHNKCLGPRCSKCLSICRFHALKVVGSSIEVIEENCEGCGACSIVCPVNAISFKVTLTGRLYICHVRTNSTIVTGDLEVGQRNTGHLVYRVKELAHKYAEEVNAKHIIVDAAAGIGCPVISSLAGADVLIIVSEPTPQSFQGAQRLLEMSRGMRLRTYLVINRYDLNEEFALKMARELDIELLGLIPNDFSVVKSYAAMKPIIEYQPRSRASQSLRRLLETITTSVMR